MPPKKDGSVPENCITGYDPKETKLLAAAFVSSIGPDKYDYALFAKLSGFTEGTLKKFWPPVKKKVIEGHPNFGTFINGGSAAVSAATSSKTAGGKKRKAADTDADAELDPKASSADNTDNKAPGGKAKKAPAKGKRGKKVKTEETVDEENIEEEENSAAGGDGVGEFVYKKHVVEWLESTDGPSDEA